MMTPIRVGCCVLLVFAVACQRSASNVQKRPEACSSVGVVCGADGVTYENDCARAAIGIKLVHVGKCTPNDTSCSATACAIGQTRCSGSGVQVCALKNGCGDWSVATPCADGCDSGNGQCRRRVPSDQSAAGEALGAACSSDAMCGEGRKCLTESTGLQFNNGYCTQDCTRMGRCPAEARCVDLASDFAVCAANCSNPGKGQGSCREGYVCEDDGTGQGFCLPRCSATSCGALGLACNDATGSCGSCGRDGEQCCSGSCTTGRCGDDGRCHL